MRSAVVVLALLAAACGKEIGDECIVASDCSANGDRQCIDNNQAGGYCTIQGCDYSTCPEESACIRFFTGSFRNIPCDPATEDQGTDACSFDELCALEGHCVPRSSEVRYCMRTCESPDDCRDGYECRGIPEMIDHGGEPVLAPGLKVDDNVKKFCAISPTG